MSKYPSKKLVKSFIPLRYRLWLRRNGYGAALKLLYALPNVSLYDLVIHLPVFSITAKTSTGRTITIEREEREEDNE